MSGLVAQHIATSSTSVLEVDDFTALADYDDCEDLVEDHDQIYDEGGQQVEEIFDNDGSEVEEEREEYLENGGDECYDVDGGDSASSVSEEEERNVASDAVEIDVACDIAVDEEICESKDTEETEVVLPPSSICSKEKSRNTSETLCTYCCINNYGKTQQLKMLCKDEVGSSCKANSRNQLKRIH